MAFDFDKEDSSESTKRSSSKNWKSDAFVNLSLPKDEGKKAKIGAIGLKLNKADHAELIKFLREGGDEALARFKNALVLDFQMADGSTSGSFDIA